MYQRGKWTACGVARDVALWNSPLIAILHVQWRTCS